MKNQILKEQKLVQLCVMIPELMYQDLTKKASSTYRSIGSIVRDILLKHYGIQEDRK